LKLSIRSTLLLTCVFLGRPGALSASGWVTAKGDYATDQHQGGLAGGGTLDDADDWTLQGSASNGSSQTGNPPVIAKVTDLGLGLGYDPGTFWDLNLDGLYSTDVNNQNSTGGTLSLGFNPDLEWFQPSVTLIGGDDRYSASATTTITGKLGRKITTKQTQTLGQTQGGLNLDLGFDDVVTIEGSAAAFRYTQDPSDPSSLFQLGRATLHAGPGVGGVKGSLLSGLVTREWSGGLALKASDSTTLSSEYAQSQSAIDHSWTKTVSADWTENWTPVIATTFSWSKAVEDGDGAPLFSLSLTYYFKAAEKSSDSDDD
jgi:hypothetical protein